ncbi:hypothetical protein [Streptomyces anulatus]
MPTDQAPADHRPFHQDGDHLHMMKLVYVDVQPLRAAIMALA